MLIRLSIHNLVIVRNLKLDFGAGMSALTGETGAGKSILIDGLGLTLGAKADAGMIRAGCDKAEVNSEFDLSDCVAAQHWLEENDLADQGACLLRRVLVREGRSRAYINGSPATQSMLKSLGDLLLDIHGQHAHQSLLRANAQRQLLDAYGGLREQAAQVAGHYQRLKSARDALENLRQAAEDRANRLDYLRFQLSELEPVLEDAENIAALEAEHQRLAHAEQLQSGSSSVLHTLSEDEQGLNHMLGRLSQQLTELVSVDDALLNVQELIESAHIQMDEAAQGLRRYLDSLELDPTQLQFLDERLGKLHDLARKHREKAALLPQLAEQFRHELTILENADQQLDSLRAELAQLQQTYQQHAESLSQARQQAAKRLSDTVTDSMQLLNMHGGRFAVACTTGEPGKHGVDHIQFLVATNPGQGMGALSSVASGGELSRLSLAIQVATSDCGQTPTLIFDEVDVGIGGAVAEIVGQLMRRLGHQRQVMCVTHLAQVAAQAHQQYRVKKYTDGSTTETKISRLDENQRADEIARMLGGVDITEQTRKHAQEMIRRVNA